MEKTSPKRRNNEQRGRLFLGILVGILLVAVFISFGYLVDIVLGVE